MSREATTAFTAALRRLERTGELDAIVGLFTDSTELRNSFNPAAFRGKAGVYRFWRNYRMQFDRVTTRFERILHEGDTAILTWTSEGTLLSGRNVRYSGATILDFEGSRIARFCAYFDPSTLLERREHPAA